MPRTDKEVDEARDPTPHAGWPDGKDEEAGKRLVGRFHTRRDFLYGDCFYSRIPEPSNQIERRIRETKLYINDAKKLVGI